MISRFGLASLALGFAVLAAPAARADGSEGMGLQAVAETMHQDSIRHSDGWQNGNAVLNASGTASPTLEPRTEASVVVGP